MGPKKDLGFKVWGICRVMHAEGYIHFCIRLHINAVSGHSSKRVAGIPLRSCMGMFGFVGFTVNGVLLNSVTYGGLTQDYPGILGFWV